jgi:hypothetical protein
MSSGQAGSRLALKTDRDAKEYVRITPPTGTDGAAGLVSTSLRVFP